jgi:hypothetical protein
MKLIEVLGIFFIKVILIQNAKDAHIEDGTERGSTQTDRTVKATEQRTRI